MQTLIVRITEKYENADTNSESNRET